MSLENQEREAPRGFSIVLDDESTARVVTEDRDLPEIVVSGAGGTVRIGLSRSGLDLLRGAVERMDACLATGAQSGAVLMYARSLAYPCDLPQRITDGRESLALSATDLARRVGVVQSSVSRIERGTLRPTLTLLGKFSTVLDVGLDELLSHECGRVDPSRVGHG